MNIYFTGNYTLDFFVKEFKKLSKFNIFQAPFCTYNQDILVSNSKFYTQEYDFTILALDGDELLAIGNYEKIKAYIKEIVDSFLKNSSNGYLIVTNLYFTQKVNSLWNYNSKENLKQIQLKINQYLNDLSIENSRIFILDILSIIEIYGEKNIYDDNLWIYSKNRFNKQGLKLLSKELQALINSILGNRKKCLVLDLDNTLWGGVIGEDGIGGILLSSDGVGSIYKKFQKEILKVKEKGILLAICSKNNLEDAKYVFDNHPHILLKWDDFIIQKVNWKLKSQNIHEIAQELNIGEDSIVFIDDNPIERDIVLNNTDAIVPNFPDNIINLNSFFAEVDKNYFSIQYLTSEDLRKNEQYEENKIRDNFKNQFVNHLEYINSLEITLEIYKDNLSQIERISQMTQKTNQFNLSTKRYSNEDIKHFINSKNHSVFTGSVKDKFGDFGIVILAIIEIKSSILILDTFLMSCRIIGRCVEDIFLCEIFNKFSENILIQAEFIETKKNIPINGFLDKFEFNCVKVEDNIKLYENKTPLKIIENLNMEIKYG